MRTKFDCVESTLDIKTDFYMIRIWVGEDPEIKSASEYKTFLDALYSHVKSLVTDDGQSMSQLATEIANLRKINAVQVKNLSSDYQRGIMIYAVPFEDKQSE